MRLRPETEHGQAARLVDAVAAALGPRRLVYAGIRGGDAEALSAIPQLAYVLSLTDTADYGRDVQSRSVEDLTYRRIDLDGDVDLGVSGRRWLLDALELALSKPAALVPYRPNADISLALLTAPSPCTYLGGSSKLQTRLEQKSWVDQAMIDIGLTTLGWRQVGALQTDAIDALLRRGPAVARLEVSSGGAGLARVNTIEDFALFTNRTGARTVSVAPYVDALPLNVGGVVWPETVTVHPLSVQLIGLPELTGREFGYCGNDFGAARTLPPEVVRAVEAQVRRIGVWLREQGYLGAFGVDMLTDGERLWFCEVNPRFQGSTRLSDRISGSLGRSGLVVEHLAAFLGLPAPDDAPDLLELSTSAPNAAHAIFHHTGSVPARIDLSRISALLRADGVETEVVCPPEVSCARHAVVLRALLDRRITADGRSLAPEAAVLTRAAEAVATGAVSSDS